MSVSALLAYQKQIEDVLRNELAVIRHAWSLAQDALCACRHDVDDRVQRHLDRARGGVTADEVRDAQAWLDHAAESVRRAQRKETELARQWEQKLADVLQAAQERRKLEVLEERARLRERRLAQWSEQRGMDDQAACRSAFDKTRDHQHGALD